MSGSGGTFFGLIVKPNKRYDTTVKETFRVGKACLDPASAGEKVTSLYVEHDTEEYIIANLHKKNLNENLDLTFSTGEKISFKVEGPGTVHLTGNILEDDPDFMDDSMMEEESDEEEEVPELTTPEKVKAEKRKQGDANVAAKKIKLNGQAAESSDDDSEDDSDDDEEDSDEEGADTTLGDLDSTNNFAEEEDSDDDDDDDSDDDDSDDDDSDDDTDSDDEEEEKPAAVKGKKPENGVAKKLETPKVDGAGEGKTPKKGKETAKPEEKTPKQQTPQPEVTKTPKQQEPKTPKTEAKTPKEAPKTPKTEAKTPKEAPKTPKTPKESKPAAVATPKSVKKTVKGGIQIEELKEGTGPEAKVGQQVGMYYSGRLKTNNKQFDACQSGKPFKFRLGKGEVIKGWDVGVVGLKVGGKRRLTIPPNMGYGSAGAPPDIPPNSTLVFDVECKYVN